MKKSIKNLIKLLIITFYTTGCNDDGNQPNTPPGIVTLKNPIANAENIDLQPALSWSKAIDIDNDDVTYTIFLDKSTNPKTIVQSNISNRSYKLANKLDYETTYSWKVQAHDGKGGISTSKISSFKTKKKEDTTSPPFGSAGKHTKVELGFHTNPFGYYEYLPEDFTISGKKFPVVIFYHGIGEKGNGKNELSRILVTGPPKLIESGKKFEAIFISPQSSHGWFSGADFLKLYNYVVKNYPIDVRRVYITGLSAGGGGAWKALASHHTKIAAAIPICGANNLPDSVSFLQNTPIWTHHNFDDKQVGKGITINNVNRIANNNESVMDVYPYSNGNNVANADYSLLYDRTTKKWTAKEGGVKPTDKLSFTLYKQGGHNAWSKTYENVSVWNWLFAQKLD